MKIYREKKHKLLSSHVKKLLGYPPDETEARVLDRRVHTILQGVRYLLYTARGRSGRFRLNKPISPGSKRLKSRRQ